MLAITDVDRFTALDAQLYADGEDDPMDVDGFTALDAQLYADGEDDPDRKRALARWRAARNAEGKNASKGKPLMITDTNNMRAVRRTIIPREKNKKQETGTAATGSSRAASSGEQHAGGDRYETHSEYARYLARRQAQLGLSKPWFRSLA